MVFKNNYMFIYSQMRAVNVHRHLAIHIFSHGTVALSKY
jgi:hypothetical protein